MMTTNWNYLPLFIDYIYNESFYGSVDTILEKGWFLRGKSYGNTELEPDYQTLLIFGSNEKISKRIYHKEGGSTMFNQSGTELSIRQYMDRDIKKWTNQIYNKSNQLLLVEEYYGDKIVNQDRNWKYEYDIEGKIKVKVYGTNHRDEFTYFDDGKIKEVCSFDIDFVDSNSICIKKRTFNYTNNGSIHCSFYSVPNSDTGSEDLSKPLVFVARSVQSIDCQQLVIVTENYDQDNNPSSTTFETFNLQGDRVSVKRISADGKQEFKKPGLFEYDSKGNWTTKKESDHRIIKREIEYKTSG